MLVCFLPLHMSALGIVLSQDKQNSVLRYFRSFVENFFFLVKTTGNNEWTLMSPRDKFLVLCQAFCCSRLIFPPVAQSWQGWMAPCPGLCILGHSNQDSTKLCSAKAALVGCETYPLGVSVV